MDLTDLFDKLPERASTEMARMRDAEKFNISALCDWSSNVEHLDEYSALSNSRIQNGTFQLPYPNLLFFNVFRSLQYNVACRRWIHIIADESKPLEYVFHSYSNDGDERMRAHASTGRVKTHASIGENVRDLGLIECRRPFWWQVPGNVSKNNELSSDEMRGINTDHSVVLAVIALLSMTGVSTETHIPSEVVNRKRVKRGKLPIFEHRTLRIDAGKLRLPKANSGGTHASPRLHSRRSHIRTLADGREIPISESQVGKKRRGVIEKTYSIYQWKGSVHV